jgi:16S rRNA (guanine(966)-N(2))-methyltransferase RsmD
MRIISGKFKGRKLIAPKKLPVRPTTDMAKEALFNILNNSYYFDAISVIDLFAGTGNITYEFASRGTKKLYAIDEDFGCIKYINSISKDFDFNINTVKSDVYKFIDKTSLTADLIFADPPYNFETERVLKIVDTVFERALLNPEGMLIIEHSKHTKLEEHAKFSYSKKYGGNVFSFFKD